MESMFSICFRKLLDKKRKQLVYFQLMIKMSVFFTHTIIMSTACATISSVFLVLVFSLGYFLDTWKSKIAPQIKLWAMLTLSWHNNYCLFETTAAT